MLPVTPPLLQMLRLLLPCNLLLPELAPLLVVAAKDKFGGPRICTRLGCVAGLDAAAARAHEKGARRDVRRWAIVRSTSVRTLWQLRLGAMRWWSLLLLLLLNERLVVPGLDELGD